ncbi:MAG: T9SS type A sorting domain-containing protein [Bacteroidetes bacterium]|nr:T9SS type A sorting domain-containing protein [Bacteroidota bacterium]
MWGLSPSDNNAQINAYKAAYNITNPCAGTEGGGPDAIDIVIEGQNFLGYPTYCVVCPDKSMYFDACYPPTVSCFDDVIADCGFVSISANFTSDFDEICQYDMVNFTDLSSGSITSWNWTFEGGDPATSTEQNPSVSYQSVGTFDVELIVSDGSNSKSLLIEDYVNVLMTPPAMLQPFEDVCQGWPAFELTGGSPTGGVYSGPGVDNGWFDPAIAGLGTHTIYYTYTASNGCDNTAENTILVDPCTGTDELLSEKFRIYPNPTNGMVELHIVQNGNIHIDVFNALGMRIMNMNKTISGEWKYKLDLTGHEQGLYFIAIQTPTEKFVKKVHLIR